jgi:hypothetical protein
MVSSREGDIMSPLFLIWILFVGVLGRESYYDLREENEVKEIRLFKQTKFGYTTYIVKVPKGDN